MDGGSYIQTGDSGRGRMAEAAAGTDSGKVKVDGEEAILHVTDQSVMFEKGGRVGGFERSAIRMVKPDGDAMIIAYSVGSEVKSVRVEPLTAVASLVASGASPTSAEISTTGLDTVFERLYWDARKELEKRLAKVQAEADNKNVRLTSEEEARYAEISRQLDALIGARFGFDPRPVPGETSPISFWDLEKRPQEFQLAVVKERHIRFLRLLVGSKAEQSDVVYSSDEVWPEDWPRILSRFGLEYGPYASEAFKSYIDHLRTHWEYKPSEKKPLLARA
jgi:hypothetical protein